MNTILSICLVGVALSGTIAQEAPKQTQISDHIYGGIDGTNSGGAQATLGTNANVYKNDAGERIDARAQVSKHFNPNGPTQYGLGLDYSAPKAGASVDVSRAERMGTVVNAGGHANIFESRDHRSRVDATANFAQQFEPRRRPDFGAGVRFIHNF